MFAVVAPRARNLLSSRKVCAPGAGGVLFCLPSSAIRLPALLPIVSRGWRGSKTQRGEENVMENRLQYHSCPR